MSRRREPPPLIPPGMFRAGEPIGRRRFVQTAGGILVATSGLSGCSEKLPAGTASGTLAVRVLGLATSPAPANGGTVVVTVTAGGQTVTFPGTVPANGFASGDVPAGNYTITYTPPSGYLLANGEVGTKTAAVTATQSAEVDFNVVAAAVPTGTLTVNVTGLGGSATSGGSASVLRTDISGQTAQVSQVPANGVLNLSVAAGTYSVTYTVPAGYTLNTGVTNPQTGLVVPANGSVSANFAVTASGGGGVVGNIYEFGFEDGTFGSLVNGSLQPISSPWAIDSTTPAFRGTKSLKQPYAPNGTNNVGTPAYYVLPASRTAYYCRFAYMQSNPFNNNGSTNNANQVKVQRGIGPGFNTQAGSFFIGQGTGANGVPQFGWDQLDTGGTIGDRGPNLNLPAPNFNNLLGQWVVVENYWDITTSGALKFKCWINGVQYFDYTDSLSNGGNTYAVIQFDGTINSMASASTAWFDTIGISSAPMGYPPP